MQRQNETKEPKVVYSDPDNSNSFIKNQKINLMQKILTSESKLFYLNRLTEKKLTLVPSKVSYDSENMGKYLPFLIMQLKRCGLSLKQNLDFYYFLKPKQVVVSSALLVVINVLFYASIKYSFCSFKPSFVVSVEYYLSIKKILTAVHTLKTEFHRLQVLIHTNGNAIRFVYMNTNIQGGRFLNLHQCTFKTCSFFILECCLQLSDNSLCGML